MSAFTLAPFSPNTRIELRPADLADVAALVRIEDSSFETDRLTRRNFQHLVRRGNASCLVETHDGEVVAYALVLFNAGTSLARLYSLAVLPAARSRGAARRLLGAIEEAARQHDCAYIRLEVRIDNAGAIELYKANGYREFGTYPDYYEDHASALRLEKRLSSVLPPSAFQVPYYRQTLDFTCGPASLMMAMRALDPSIELSRRHELRLWRESTTIFMTSGHGGCAPLGLALAAWRRGFGAEIYVNDDGPLFLDTVRSEEKKEVMRTVHEDFLEEIAGTGIVVHHGRLGAHEMADRIARGEVPIVLISSYRIYREKFPHWVVVTGADERFIYAHDPFVDDELHKTEIDCINMPIARKDFERMAQYGRSQLKATVVLKAR